MSHLLSIKIPNNNILERKYIIIELFKLLNYDIEIVIDSTLKACSVLSYNNYNVYFNDSFFSEETDDLKYINKQNLPNQLKFIDSKLTGTKLVVIYGNEEFSVNSQSIYCGLDIFASAFFMLTRWEEIVIAEKDKFDRCSEDAMFVVKNGIYNRPIVDEYVQFLRDLLSIIGLNSPIPKDQFSISLTHDVDYLFRYADFKNFIQNLAGDILNRKNLFDFFRTFYNYLLFKVGKRLDPFDTFDEIMDLSDSIGVKSAFYFKPSVFGEYDCTYNIFDRRVVEIMNNIVKRGHEIGIHPSKNTFRNPNQFRVEVERLKSLGFEIYGGRQHFLLYDLPYTLRYWHDNNLDYDAGLGFAFRAGFRCGTSHQFNFFDCIKRETLSIKVKPLIVMEGALFDYKWRHSLSDIEQEIIKLVDQVRMYSGCFVFLWHNDRFYRPESIKTISVYKNILSYISNLYNA